MSRANVARSCQQKSANSVTKHDKHLPASVSTQPGLIARVLMPLALSSTAYLAIKIFPAALLTEYPRRLGISVARVVGISPIPDEM